MENYNKKRLYIFSYTSLYIDTIKNIKQNSLVEKVWESTQIIGKKHVIGIYYHHPLILYVPDERSNLI